MAISPPVKSAEFLTLVADRWEEFPTIARAAKDARPANSIRIEWPVDTLVSGRYDEPNMQLAVWHNYTQIFRSQVKSRPDKTIESARDEASDKMLAGVEKALIYGVPFRNPNPAPYSTLGGYRHYLGRPLNDADIIRLRPLRMPLYRVIEWDYRDGSEVALDYPIAEWLCETSLEVIPQVV